MRLKYWVIALSAVIVLALGILAHYQARNTSEALLDILEQVRIAVASGDQSNAVAQADALRRDWHRHQTILQLLLPHRDTDAVELALTRLIAVVGTEDAVGAAREIAESRFALNNLTHRESPSAFNIL